MAKKENEEEEDKEKCLEGKEKKGQRKVLKELSKINRTRRRRNILAG